MKQFPNHIRSKSILQKIFLKNEQRKASKLITAEHDGQRSRVADVLVKAWTLLFSAKFMTEPKCGEAQADDSSLGGAAANLLLGDVAFYS